MKRLALLCLLVLTACSALPASSPDVPPVGTIWFGESFDPKTLELTGKTTSVGTGDPLVMVANVGKSVTVADLKVRESANGDKRPLLTIKSKAKGAVFGLEMNRIGTPGKWKYEILDTDGKVLASGTITVT
jgi:hypothetical protein